MLKVPLPVPVAVAPLLECECPVAGRIHCSRNGCRPTIITNTGITAGDYCSWSSIYNNGCSAVAATCCRLGKCKAYSSCRYAGYNPGIGYSSNGIVTALSMYHQKPVKDSWLILHILMFRRSLQALVHQHVCCIYNRSRTTGIGCR